MVLIDALVRVFVKLTASGQASERSPESYPSKNDLSPLFSWNGEQILCASRFAFAPPPFAYSRTSSNQAITSGD
jgi:hypothetical protein